MQNPNLLIMVGSRPNSLDTSRVTSRERKYHVFPGLLPWDGKAAIPSFHSIIQCKTEISY